MNVSPLTHELRLAEMARALRGLSNIRIEDRESRFAAYREGFDPSCDAAALRIEKTRRLAFGEANILGEVA